MGSLPPCGRGWGEGCGLLRRAWDEEHFPRRDALLKFDATVHCDEDIILVRHTAQQLAVLYPGPAATGNGIYGMTRKFCARPMGKCSSSSTRVGRESFTSKVE